MEISAQYSVSTFKSRCPEIKLGQNVCHLVNTEFPHYSLTKFNPMITKHLSKIKSPANVMMKIIKFDIERPSGPESYSEDKNYLMDLFGFINDFHSFNCQESAVLAELMLKLNGFKNSYIAYVRDGGAEKNHAICLFNKDGSEIAVKNEKELIPNIENNKTIIIDPWANICDFANVVLKEYRGFWSQYITPVVLKDKANGIYNLLGIKKMNLPEEFLDAVKSYYPNLIFKNFALKKR